jgi:hypothetical protein
MPNVGAKFIELTTGARFAGVGVAGVDGVDGLVGVDEEPPPQATTANMEVIEQAIRILRMTLLGLMDRRTHFRNSARERRRRDERRAHR